jgi:hypothetical protein
VVVESLMRHTAALAGPPSPKSRKSLEHNPA